MNPRISIIVPIYNCEPYIEECLGSLTAQTFEDFEAICVDDASTDRSLAKARAAVSQDTRFTFYELPENRGQSAARNLALDHAAGQIIMFLDSDDYLTPDALELIAKRFAEQSLDDLYFNAKTVYEDANAYKMLVEDFSGRCPHPDVATGMELFTFFESKGQFYPHGALRAISRELLRANRIRFREGMIHEDLLFTFQTLVASRRSSFLHEQIYLRRIRSGSTMGTARRSLRNIEGHLISIRWMKNWMRENAARLDADFIEAMAHRLNEYSLLCAEDYMRDVTADEKAAYKSQLSPAELVEFELEVAQRSSVYQGLVESPTFKAGQAVTALPKAIRNKAAEFKRRYKD